MRVRQQFDTFSDFEKIHVFFETTKYFFKKTLVLNVLRNLTASVAFYSKIASIWQEKSRSELWTNIVSAIGEHPVKKCTLWVKDTAAIFY